MEITTMFFIALGMAAFGILGALFNMAMAMRNMENGRMSSMVGLHMFFGFFYMVGGIGAAITGIIWVVQQFS